MNVCGAPAQEYALEKQFGTGSYVNHWFCRRHLGHLTRVREQVKEQNELAPDPIPPRGGLLACYFDSYWLRICHWAGRESWEPPVSAFAQTTGQPPARSLCHSAPACGSLSANSRTTRRAEGERRCPRQ